MKTLIVYAVITVWTFKAFSVNGTLSISDSGSNTVGSKNYVLACNIVSYTNQASWERDGTIIGQCPTSGCFASTDTRYTFSNDAGAIYANFLQLQANEDGVIWKCKHGFDPVANFTVEVVSSNSLCDGDSEANTTLTCCSLIPAIVKLLIILWLWCNKPKPVPPPIEPEPVPPPIGFGEVIFITVTAQRQLTSAIQNINGQPKDIPLSGTMGRYLYSIGVRAGELLDCAFQSGENVLALSFKINDDVLYVKHGQHITLPTTLKVIPPYSRITWDLNGKPFEVREPLFKTQVTKHTYGVYGIRMTFERLEIVICIQNMKVQEPKPVPPPIGTYWILMVVFVVIDIVCGVIGGSVTGYYRSTDGYCVDVKFIILMVLTPMIFFNVLEVALIYFMLIKGTESKESSGDPDSSITMMSTSTKRTVSPNAGTTRSLTDGLSSSEVTATTYEGQNNRNWQPPNANTAVNPDAHQ